MEFITTDGKLLLEGNTIKQKRLTNTRRTNILLYCYFLLFIINLTVERIDIAQVAGKTSRWISVGIHGVFLLLYIGVLFEFLFRQYLKSNVDILKIDKITTYPSDEGLETNVVLTMKSKRYKHYKFRTLEKQYDRFIETIRSSNPNTQLVTE